MVAVVSGGIDCYLFPLDRKRRSGPRRLRAYAAGDSWLFAKTKAEDEATRKPRRSIFIIDDFNIYLSM
jgi:hypothetical protein